LIWKPLITEGKLSRSWDGPYLVVKRIGESSFMLADPTNRKKFRRHARHLRPIRERENLKNSEPDFADNPNIQNLDNPLLNATEYEQEFDNELPFKWKSPPILPCGTRA
jgi:hypothetical protein